MTAEIPFLQDRDARYGEAERISPLIRRVLAKNPGPFTYTGTGVFIIGEGEVAILDPGPEDAAHLAAVESAVKGETVTAILVSHTHKDHSQAARTLAARTGAPLYAFGAHGDATPLLGDMSAATEEGADRAFRPDHAIGDGYRLSGPGWTIEALHTPGHTSNHLCFALCEEKTLFTGDHLMGWATSVIIPPDGDMDDYLASLNRFLDRDDAIYRPTHGPAIERPQRFARAVIGHRMMRERQILDRLAIGPAAVPEIVDTLYRGLDSRLRPAAALSVLAHLIRLEKTGAATRGDGAILHALWRAQ